MKQRTFAAVSGRAPLQRGLSMVELLVALAIGSLLIIGAVFVYSQSRTTHTLSETVARLQENARFAMAVLEPDVTLAGDYGYFNVPSVIRYSDGTVASDMQQEDGKFNASADGVHACGKNFAYDVIATVQGVESGYGLDCAVGPAGMSSTAADQSDTLIIRRASTTAALVADPKKLQLFTNRLAPTNQVMFSGALPEATQLNFKDVRDIVTDVYYVSKNSDARLGFPSLRRKSLQVDAATNKLDMVDEEIMAGVEDMQVQFGLDMGRDRDGDGAPDDKNSNGVADSVNGQVSRYVNPDTASAANIKFGQIVSVRIWLRLRADQGEVGYKDETTYKQGSADFTPNDNVRRIIATRTFFLRNARSTKKSI